MRTKFESRYVMSVPMMAMIVARMAKPKNERRGRDEVVYTVMRDCWTKTKMVRKWHYYLHTKGIIPGPTTSEYQLHFFSKISETNYSTASHICMAKAQRSEGEFFNAS